ncbi:hypothetical protein [Halorubrum tailed virus BLv36]|nr:hypothetical protein [Halorubrum tailed virus BLv36]
MKWETALRVGGIVGVISLGFVAAEFGLSENELLILIGALVALVAPEALDKLPFGPSKK